MSSISTTLTHGIFLGIGYASPLTITTTGYINAGTSGANGAAIYGAFGGPTVLTLVNDGRVAATGTVAGVFEGTDGGLVIANTGTISAVANGITLQRSGPVANSGTIISSGAVAVQGNTGLQVTNAIGGVISGYGVGIKAASGTITNYGTIQGTATSSTAIYLNGGGNDGIVSNYGLLSATYDGIQFRDSGTLSNSGTITSTGRYGVRFDGSTASVTNSGTITGNNALKILGDGTVSNTGQIVGQNGVAISGAASLSNAGTIEATYGTGVVLGSGGTISNTAAGVITATGYTGVTISGGAGIITNEGTISGYTGIAFYTAGTASQTVIDSGTIIGSGGAAVVFGAGDDLLQLQPGDLLIEGNVDGGGGNNTLEFASAAGTGTLTGVGAAFVNFQTMEVDLNASWVLAGSNAFGNAVSLADSGSLTITGNVVANIYGNPGAAPLTVTSTGSLWNGGAGAAVYFNSGAVGNYGTITAGGNTSYDVGVRFRGAGSVVNIGTITGHYGVLSFGYLNASNIGVIGDSGSRDGVFLRGGGSLTNSGTITGAVGIGGPILSLAVYINNSGTVSGLDGIALNALDTTAATIVDSGTIIGSAGSAVQFGAGDDLLQFQPSTSAFIEGVVDGGAGTNTLEFASAATTGTLTGLGADFVNFSQGTVDAGASWVLAGSNTFAAGNTLTLYGSLANAGTLDNAGTILVADYSVLQLAPGGYLLNEASGIIDRIPGGATTFPDPTVVGLYGGASTITNLGTITNTYATGIYLQGGGTIVNGAAGTTVSPATIYGMYYGVLARNNPATVTNYGVIAAGTCGCGTYDGVHLSAGGSVTNAQFATISGYLAGVFMNATGSVSNAGSITGYNYVSAGIELNRGGSVTNTQSGYVEGTRFGVVVYHAAGTVTNLGTITTYGTYGLYGVGLRDGGTVVNGASGTTVSSAMIYGGSAGVILYGAPGTVTNYGTIVGNAGGVILVSGGTVIDAGVISGGLYNTAIYFGAPDALLVLENGYAITGVITATGTGNVVELQGTAGDAVRVNYNSLTMISVGTIAFAPGAANYATLLIDNTAALPGTIAGFIGPHDTVDLMTLSDAGNDATTSFDAGTSQLTVTAGGASVTLQLDNEDYTGVGWLAQNDGFGGTRITVGSAAPTISGTRANQAVPNQTASTPFSTVIVTDPGATDTATVTLSAPGNGAFSNLSGGSYNAATGVYSVTGTAAAVTAALDALVFTPMAQANAYVTTTTFSLSVQGIGGSASDNKTSVTSVQQILSLASVPSSQIAISVSPDGSGFAAPQGGMTNEAVVSAPTSGASYVVPAGFQALFLGGTANATLNDASVGNALLVANQGNDVLFANAANDVLVAGSGNNTLAGGAFASTVVGGSGAATVFAGTGVMQVFGGSGSLVFGGGVNGGSTVAGGSGMATLYGGSGGNSLLTGGTGQATIIGGGSGDMLLAAGTAGDRLYAGSGSETLSGSGAGGNDLLVAGGGNAVMFGGTGADSIAGGSGLSTVSAGAGSPTVFAGSGAMLVYGGSGAMVFGGGANAGSTVVGGTGVATLFGGTGGNSLLFGGQGATTIVGGGSGDRLIGEGSAGNRIFAGAGNETLAGSNAGGNDLLVAGSGNDMVFAGNGSDTIVAGSGNSQFVADGGSVLFVFSNGQAGGSDIIWNFTQGRDHVLLANYGANAVPTALAGAVSAGGSTTITLADNTRITFGGIGQLTAHDFA